MRIVVDLQGAQTASRFRGIGRYSLSFTQALLRQSEGHEVIVALNGSFVETIEPIRGALDSLMPQENIRVWEIPTPVKYRDCDVIDSWRRDVAKVIRNAFLASLNPDVVVVTSLFEGFADNAITSLDDDSNLPVWVILYDLIPLLDPQTFLTPDPAYKQFYMERIAALKKATGWLAISKASEQEAVATLSLDRSRMTTIMSGCDAIFRPVKIALATQDHLYQSLGIKGRFILYSGSAEARKNLIRLVEAYVLLGEEMIAQYQLVLVGIMDDEHVQQVRDVVQKCGLSKDRVIFSGYVSDVQLNQLYNLCRVFVFPSLHEGFGLPVLEAMRCGAVVIGADATSIPEVISCPEALFDPRDTLAIRDKLDEALNDEEFRQRLKVQAALKESNFSWDETAKRALRAIEKAVNRRAPVSTDTLLTRAIDQVGGLLPDHIDTTALLHVSRCLNEIRPEAIDRCLYLDVSEIVSHDYRTGVQRVTRGIVRELFQVVPDCYRVVPVYATTERIGYRRICNPETGTLTISDHDEVINPQCGDIFLGVDLHHQIVDVQKYYLAKLRRHGVRVFFVVYDLLPIQFPHFFPEPAPKIHEQWLRTISGYDGALCISRSVGRELLEWIQRQKVAFARTRPFQVSWFHLGGDVENTLPTYGIPERGHEVLAHLERHVTFLAVGTVEPRKGYSQLVEAFELLWQDNPNVRLVIVGKRGWKMDAFWEKLDTHAQRNRCLFWFEGISDEYLERLYAVASCLISTSYGEGFGLPLIEAAQHHLPLLVRDIPVFREVAEQGAFYFDNDRSAEVLEQAIRTWLQLYRQQKHPQSDTIHVQTWQQSAQQVVAALFKGANAIEL
jgi:glycosyltransferase involved in cell wall biosynthesis